jgi:hypothetical protein
MKTEFISFRLAADAVKTFRRGLMLGSLLLSCLTGGSGQARAQDLPAGQSIDPATLSWPRFYATNGYEFALYQPEISAWPGNELSGRLVVAVRSAGTTNETYGVVFFQARTDIDKVNRLVTFDEFQVTRVNFPSQPAMQDQYRTMLLSFQKHAVKVVPLDHLEAVFAASADITQAKVQSVKNDPPQIIYASQPSLLVLVDGPPVLAALGGDYQRVVNTRAILLYNQNPLAQSYYLYADNQWFSAAALTGPWLPNSSPPSDIDTALSLALATKEVDPMPPQDANAPSVSQVYVSTVPAELIETQGAPNMVSVPNTDLLYVENSSSAIFNYLDDTYYYVLISGRWFKAPGLNGPWVFVQPGTLPGDFAKIPTDNEKSNVRMSVPGTPEAQEAVIANSIPQTATIQRDQASLAVSYSGAPSFTPIEGTTLYYAANTQTPVVMVSPNSFYACQGGVWFTGAAAQGPWMVATAVPAAIYTIPASCPVHYITYSYVYGATATVVYVGYTPGYMGTVVAPGGVVVYGTGYYYPPVVVGSVWVGYPPSYGYGASFALGAAVGFSFGYCAGSVSTCGCEPYWGSYHWATASGYSYAHCNVNACNYYTHWGTAVHGSGSYGYNAYTGTSWASHSATTFNPYTGSHGSVNGSAAYNPYSGNASASRSGSGYNPSSGASAQGSSSASANRYNGNYSGNRQASGYNPTTGSGASGSSSISGNAQSGNYNASRQGSYNNASSGESVSGQQNISGNTHNGTESVSGSGSAANSKTGNSTSWNNGSMTSDKNGNVYSYNQGQSSQNRSTAQNENSASHPSGGSYASNDSGYRGSSAQETGSQRFSSFSRGGGGGWSGSGGGGGGGGFRR